MTLPISLDMTKEKTTSEGTGPFVLGGRWSNEFLPFPANGGPYVFRIRDPQDGKWVLFQGMVDTVSGVHMATVTTVLKNSAGATNMFTFGAGTKEISAVYPAVLANAISAFLDEGGGADALAASVSNASANLYDLTAVVGALNAGSLGGMLAITEDRIYYVDTVSGSDTNNGLTGLTAFATIGKAWQVIQSQIVAANVTINLLDDAIALDDTVTLGDFMSLVGTDALASKGSVTLAGKPTTGTAISCATASTLVLDSIQGKVRLRNLILSSSVGSALTLRYCRNVYIQDGDLFEFAATTGSHIILDQSWMRISIPYTISGGAYEHIHISKSTFLMNEEGTGVTIIGTPNFNTFAFVGTQSHVDVPALESTGSATGIRYSLNRFSILGVGGGGAFFLPGDVDGTDDGTGIYL